MRKRFNYQAAGRCTVKPDTAAAPVCTNPDCGHVELAHQVLDGVPCGPCLYRGCKCPALDVSEALEEAS